MSRDRGSGGPLLPHCCSNQQHPRATSEKLCPAPNPSHCHSGWRTGHCGVWGHFPLPAPTRPQAGTSQQKIKAHVIKPLHPPGCSPCHLHRSFLPTGGLGGGVKRIAHRDIPNSPAQGPRNDKLVMVAKDSAKLETCQPS